MFKFIYPEKDSTIYERHPNRNTGVDQILELVKNVRGTRAQDQVDPTYTWGETYNSRILLKFNLNEISKSISSNTISKNCKFYISLRATEAVSTPTNFTIYTYPIASEWENGNGSYYNIPETTNGVSWRYKESKINDVKWLSGSYPVNVTGSWQTQPGGGNWYTNFVASQSIDLQIPDIRMDVTNIVKGWISGSIPNYGFIIKYHDKDEANDKIFGSIKYFGKETHTIFIPRLETYWNGETINGSNFTEINSNDYILSLKNIKESYKESETTKIRLSCRPRYPMRTYSTSSAYKKEYRLPTSSYFSIVDVSSGDTIVPFSEIGTQIGCDLSGNFININMNSFLPERYYKIIVKATHSSIDERYIDDGFYFKVIR